jgi:hypothetical protein
VLFLIVIFFTTAKAKSQATARSFAKAAQHDRVWVVQ